MTEKIEKAIATAVKLHKNQKRNGDGTTPYIVHPVSVALIMAPYIKNEDVIAAAILHDVLEDTNIKHSEFKKLFGKKIYNLVKDVSDKNPKDSWHDRKDAYLKYLKQASKEACLIACADKIHNLTSMSDAYKKFGDSIWKRFSTSKEEKIKFYESVYKEVKKRSSHPLIKKLGCTLRETKKALKIK